MKPTEGPQTRKQTHVLKTIEHYEHLALRIPHTTRDLGLSQALQQPEEHLPFGMLCPLVFKEDGMKIYVV